MIYVLFHLGQTAKAFFVGPTTRCYNTLCSDIYGMHNFAALGQIMNGTASATVIANQMKDF